MGEVNPHGCAAQNRACAPLRLGAEVCIEDLE
jgi:hypothetical protein